MHIFFTKLEHLVDALIPYSLVLLVGIIIVEFARPELVEAYPAITYLDMSIIGLFVVDLCFKYHHSKSIPSFLKTHWLEIIAVFPFFLIFRLLDGLGLLSFAIGETAVREGQSVVHAGEVATKEAEAVVKTLSTAEKDVAVVSKLTRAQQLTRFVKPVFDSRKTLHAAHFYEHPARRKHHAA